MSIERWNTQTARVIRVLANSVPESNNANPIERRRTRPSEEPGELMQTGLTITPAWFDSDVVLYRIEASNGKFCGTAHVYAGHESPRAWAEQLAGFPQRVSDRRRLTWGASGPEAAGGFADLQWACVDAAGHAALEIVLVSDWRRSGEAMARVEFRLDIMAAALDRFVEQLRTLRTDPPNSAHLPLAP